MDKENLDEVKDLLFRVASLLREYWECASANIDVVKLGYPIAEALEEVESFKGVVMETFSGTVKKIHPSRPSRSGRINFIRVDFTLDDGTFAKTDLCPGFRNFPRWSSILSAGEGARADGLVVNRGSVNLVNADSSPRFIGMAEPVPATDKRQEELFHVGQ